MQVVGGAAVVEGGASVVLGGATVVVGGATVVDWATVVNGESSSGWQKPPFQSQPLLRQSLGDT